MARAKRGRKKKTFIEKVLEEEQVKQTVEEQQEKIIEKIIKQGYNSKKINRMGIPKYIRMAYSEEFCLSVVVNIYNSIKLGEITF